MVGSSESVRKKFSFEDDYGDKTVEQARNRLCFCNLLDKWLGQRHRKIVALVYS